MSKLTRDETNLLVTILDEVIFTKQSKMLVNIIKEVESIDIPAYQQFVSALRKSISTNVICNLDKKGIMLLCKLFDIAGKEYSYNIGEKTFIIL